MLLDLEGRVSGLLRTGNIFKMWHQSYRLLKKKICSKKKKKKTLCQVKAVYTFKYYLVVLMIWQKK